ncbi:hypothetical protein B0H17DRAFT_1265075 [Mycena rosella]|uniref:Uncharacterized protein n=1 Tax=Mycena rosella TaxID=1033263 RepID=A0AAD7DQP6_MYCRO|nr:hypothetical protein B0H17DRAFT_1265075 [Mycena rosella]
MPLDFDELSPVKGYLAEAVGPYPASWDNCQAGFAHDIQIYSAAKKSTKKTVSSERRIGEYSFHGHPAKCRSRYAPQLSLHVAETLAEGVRELKEDMPKGKGGKDAAKEMARVRGRVAWAALAAVAAADSDDEDVPPRKKARRVNQKPIAVVAAADSNDEDVPPRKKAGRVNQKPKAKLKPKAKAQPKAKSATPDAAAPAVGSVDEYDEYSPLLHDTIDLDTRNVTLVIYTTADTPAIEHVVHLRYLPGFKISYFKIAEEIRLTGPSPVAFERYCVFAGEFEPEALNVIDMTARGGYMLYRNASLTDAQCPDIKRWMSALECSATYTDQHNSSDATTAEDDELDSDKLDSDIEILHFFTPSKAGSSQTPASSVASGSKPARVAPLKRSRAEFVEGSSRAPFTSAYLEEEQKWWTKENKD